MNEKTPAGFPTGVFYLLYLDAERLDHAFFKGGTGRVQREPARAGRPVRIALQSLQPGRNRWRAA
jgi:hypothetical protein